MLAPIHVHALTVTINQSKEFFTGIENTLRTMTHLQLQQIYFINTRLRAINISYSGSWQPFFGFTAGFTREEDRVYITEKIWLLTRIGNFLDELNLGIPGGRVSINSLSAIKRLDDYSLINLCLIQWQGEDVWQKCNTLLRDARSRAHPT